MSKKKDIPSYSEFSDHFYPPAPIRQIPAKCANVLVINQWGGTRYQGKVLGHATDGFGEVQRILVDRNSSWKKAEWVHTCFVYEVSE